MNSASSRRPASNLVHRVSGRVVGNQHGDARDDRKRAAVAAEHAGFDALVCADEGGVVDERHPAAAKGAAQQIKQGVAHGPGG